MKYIFFLATFFLLLSCKNDKKISSNENSLTLNDTLSEVILSKSNDNESCYIYLTELIRSSNFPFETIKKEKVNTVIDEDNGEIIRAKLIFDTNGTGTIGWVEYHLKDRKLFNSSANLEEPEQLNYDVKFAKKFEKCRGIVNLNSESNSENTNLENIYSKSKLVKLPNKYSYEFVSEERDFIQVPTELYKNFDFGHYSNFKIAKLPNSGVVKPVILLIYNEAGESSLYLITLDKNYEFVDKLKLFESEQVDEGSLSTTYEINEDYIIKIKTAKLIDVGSKVIEKNAKFEIYKMNSIGEIEKK